jgi:general secretion pathway protein D
MRIVPATLLLVPALALAQVPIRPSPETRDTQSPRPAPAPPRVPPAPSPGGAARPAQPPRPPGAQPDAAAPAPRSGPSTATTARATDARCVPLAGRFMLQFNKADIADVLEQASRWTCRNFMFTEDVARGKISLLSKTPVTAEEAYAAFLAALNSNNIAVYPTGKYYKLVRIADAKKNPIPTYVGEDSGTPFSEQPVTKVIRLSHADADQLRGVVGNFISPQGADVQSIPPNMLIITDIGLNIRRIERIIEAVDRAGAGDQVRLIQIRFASAKDIAEKVNQIFQAQGGAGGRPGTRSRQVLSAPAPRTAPGGAPAQAAPVQRGGDSVEVSVTKVLPDERTNKLIVIADEKSFQRIQELIDQLDVPTAAEGGIHVVFLRNANAEELAQTLSNLAQGAASGRRAPGQGAPAGGLTPTPVPAANMPPGTPPTARPGGAADVTAELFSGDVKVTADKTQNALLIQASGADFQAINRLVQRLDLPRRQVFVEAVIMEVNLRNELQLGVGAHTAVSVDYRGDKAVIPLVSKPGISSLDLTNIIRLGGFLTGFVGPTSSDLSALGIELPSLGLLVQALQTNSDVNVLSTPHLLASDNEESEITVGQNVPFQAGYAPQGISSLAGGATGNNALGNLLGAGGFSSLIAPIQRQNVELRVKLKPQINEGGNVRLTLEVQNEEIAERDAQLGPTTSKRTVKSQVVAKDQSTIVIGGLIQERNIRSIRKIPFFGSLPVVGWLFRDTVNTKSKTNLLLFLTPYIIRDEADYRRIYERKRKEQEQFMQAFYGRQSSYEVDVDFTRKSGPYAHIRAGVAQETAKLENGGPGGPGETLIAPPGSRGEQPLPPTGAPRRPAEPSPDGVDETEVDRLDVQPDVSGPDEPPPPAPPENAGTPPPPQPQPPQPTDPGAPVE